MSFLKDLVCLDEPDFQYSSQAFKALVDLEKSQEAEIAGGRAM